MSSCRCCLPSHPLRLIERLNSSIQTVKLIRRNCSIFETIVFDEYEQLERLSSNLNRYLTQYGTISNRIFSSLSQFTMCVNNRLENLTKISYELECLTIKCSIWLKNHSTKTLRSQLKHSGKQLDLLLRFHERHSYIVAYKNNTTKPFSKDFSVFQTNYQQQCLQMDSIDREHMKLFLESIQLFASMIPLGNNQNLLSTININQDIEEWKDKHRFRIPWLPDEHQRNENEQKLIEHSSSEIEIKAIEHDGEDQYAHESNLSWSFTIATKTDDLLSIPPLLQASIDDSKPSQPILNVIKPRPINRVRLAIEAIERNKSTFPRERKS